MDDYRKIGLGLTCAGVLFLVLGVMLFFDKGLLAMGNILFLAGVSLIIGPRGVFRFFFQKRKVGAASARLGHTGRCDAPTSPPHNACDGLIGSLSASSHNALCTVSLFGVRLTLGALSAVPQVRGTSCFLGGIFLVLVGWPVFGMAIELFGFLNLFGDFFPVVLGFLRNLPIVGNVLALPPVRAFTDRFVAKARLPV
mmetsp:Transcript_8070/g.24217  ORF Transcript_8070/g.24217 Transcript_8070/m.24217 type:complete len:197 (+) Transcript_8070:31-621(+)